MMNVQRKIRLQLDPLKKASYLQQEVARRLVDRMNDIKKPEIFNSVVGIGENTKYLFDFIEPGRFLKKQCNLDICELSQKEEFQAAFSNLYFHALDNLQDSIKAVSNSLLPDGLFMLSAFGSETLVELKNCIHLAELERLEGVGLHFYPTMRIEDLGNLLSYAKFNLITTDWEDIVVYYPSMIDLLDDIYLMGEANCLEKLRSSLTRNVIMAANSIYRELYSENVKVAATFRILYGIGWKHSDSQPKPKERGTALQSLGEVL